MSIEGQQLRLLIPCAKVISICYALCTSNATKCYGCYMKAAAMSDDSWFREPKLIKQRINYIDLTSAQPEPAGSKIID